MRENVTGRKRAQWLIFFVGLAFETVSMLRVYATVINRLIRKNMYSVPLALFLWTLRGPICLHAETVQSK